MCTAYFDPSHDQRAVFNIDHLIVTCWSEKRRPTAAGIKLRIRFKKLSSTCPAGIYPCSICIPVLAGKWWFGAGFSKNFKSFRSEEHTSELQSRFDIVCRPLL